jgi:hypothetical protein
MNVHAQGKFSIGLGTNLVSNADLPGLYSYIAPSLNLGYNLYQGKKVSIGIENTTSIRQVIENNSSELGFVTAFPVRIRYDFPKTFVNVGAGPGYLKQSVKNYQYNQTAKGYCIDFMGGAGIKLPPFFFDIFYPEINLRISYLKNFQHAEYDAGMLSLILFFRAKQSDPK